MIDRQKKKRKKENFFFYMKQVKFYITWIRKTIDLSCCWKNELLVRLFPEPQGASTP